MIFPESVIKDTLGGITSESPVVVTHSVIIVSYNCWESLDRCLSSVASHAHHSCEVIVVDNASRDQTISQLKLRSNVKLIASPTNLGYAEGCNVGAKQATGKYITFLNPDTVVTPDWLNHLSAHFGTEGVAAVGPTSNYVAGLQKVQIHGVEASARYEDSVLIADHLYKRNRGHGVRTKLLIGFCMMMERETFWKMGGMDTNLFLGNDDLDISWRLQLAGLQMVVATDTFVYHEGQKSFQTEPNAHTQKLVQESTNALYTKMVHHYGSEDKVPSARDLWGMEWFTPTNKGKVSIGSHLFADAEAHPTWIVWIPYRSDALVLLRRTLESLTHIPAAKVILLNSGNSIWIENFSGQRFEPPAGQPLQQSLQTLLKMVDTQWVGWIPAGLTLTPFFERQYLSRLSNVKNGTEIPIKGFSIDGAAWLAKADVLVQTMMQMGKESKESIQTGTHLYKKIADALGWASPMDVSPLIGISEETNAKRIDAHVDLLQAVPQETDHNNKENVIKLFPESLQSWLRQMGVVGFCQSQQQHIWDMQGHEVVPHDLEGLVFSFRPGQEQYIHPELKIFKTRFKNLKEIIFLLLPNEEGSSKQSMQALSAELRKCIWDLGFVIRAEAPYSGIPDSGDHAGALQWTVAPRSVQYSLDKKVSIIILGFNQVKYTKLCIDSLVKNTRQKYELILIDNGSTDETAEYFKSIAGAKAIINADNLGVARGWNQGLRAATGDYLCILNNDTLLPPNWLENMVRLCESDPKIGLVGPRSNNISGPQKVEATEIKTVDDVWPYAECYHKEHDLSAIEYERVTGFCLVMSRPVFKSIGYFDERFGKGNFEDDDYCIRARYMGYRLMFANDSFVFHFGSVSFSHASVDWRALMDENRKKFEQKWARGSASLSDVFIHADPIEEKLKDVLKKAWDLYTSGDVESSRSNFLLAAEIRPECAEAYNGLGILAFHQKKWDEGLQLLRKALQLCPSDIDVAENIIELLDQALDSSEALKCIHAFLVDFPGHSVFVREAEKRSGPSTNKVDDWKREIEKWVSRKEYTTALDFVEKLVREGRELAFAYNAMGIIAYQCGDLSAAFGHFSKSLEFQLLDEDVLLNYFDAGILLNKNSEVLATLERALSMPAGQKMKEISQQCFALRELSHSGSWDPQTLIHSREKNIAGENLIREGLPKKATVIFEELLKNDPNNFRAHNNMGLVGWYHGEQLEAWKHFSLALDIHPGFADALINLFDAALALHKIPDFVPYLQKFLTMHPENEEAIYIQRQIGELADKVYLVKNFQTIDPTMALLEKGHQAMIKGELDKATMAYLDVIDKDPDKSMAYNGLGLVAYYRRMYAESYKLFTKAVDLNPLDEDALVNLWEVSRLLSMEEEVRPRLQAAIEVDPCMQSISKILSQEPPSM